ncbi:MAG: hypothetical protein AB9861_16840 [Methanosarcina sp.]
MDTNVLVGYVFKIDDLNYPSIYVISSKFDKYSSDNVKREFERICKDKVYIAKKELEEILIKLSRKNSKLDNKKLLSVLNKYFLKPSITSLFDANLSTRDPKILAEKLRMIMRDFEVEYWKNNSILDGCIVFVSRKGMNYREVSIKLSDCGLVFSNSADSEIVLDAHHIGLTISDNLHFVTEDFGDILKRKDAIINCTSIKDIIRLTEFSDFCNLSS